MPEENSNSGDAPDSDDRTSNDPTTDDDTTGDPTTEGGTTDDRTSEAPRFVRYRVRRSPNLRAFLGTGAVLGMIVGIVVAVVGPDSRCEGVPGRACQGTFEPSASLAYFLVLGALAGIAVAAAVAAVVDSRATRR